MRSIYVGLFAIPFVGCQDSKNDPLTKNDISFEGSGMVKGNDFAPSDVFFQGFQAITHSFREDKGASAGMVEISFPLSPRAEDIQDGSDQRV